MFIDHPNFDKAESVGRNRFKNFLFSRQNLLFRKELPISEEFDISFASGFTTNIMLTEVKNRNVNSTSFNDSFLEIKKIYAIERKRKWYESIYGFQLKSLFVALYKDGTGFIWDFTNFNPNDYLISEKLCNSKTAVFVGKELKQVAHFQFNRAIEKIYC